jgi:sulfatase modifying factor 1
VGATVWIPSESEWYKAAHYAPNKGGAEVGGYWAQATQSDTITTNDIGVAGAANYGDANGYAIYTGGASWAITNVGAYGLNSDSAYGTNDQAGNVKEWNDTVVGGSSRGLRGGAWGSNSDFLPAADLTSNAPTTQSTYIGFRVASVPETSAGLLTMLSASALLTRRRRSPL